MRLLNMTWMAGARDSRTGGHLWEGSLGSNRSMAGGLDYTQEGGKIQSITTLAGELPVGLLPTPPAAAEAGKP